MKISLIGASGFLGSNLIKTLEQKEYELDLFDIKPSDKINYLDLRDNNSLLGLSKCDVLINLAAEHADNVSPKSLYYEVNVKGPKNICQAAEKLDIQKIIFF